jgi:hypothetical protein
MNTIKNIYQLSITRIMLLSLAFLIMQTNIFAQHNYGGHFNPDSLTQITISGTTIIDTNNFHSMYYLDENSDGVADYHLNFGPYWYEPNVGNAKRPINGEAITVFGGLHDDFNEIKTIVVYEINGEFWREPFEPNWVEMGNHSHGGGNGHHQGGCSGYAFGFDHNTLMSVTLNGTALVDTTFIMASYYLDVNEDALPDYFLNFGPPWYAPNNGTERPIDGEQISISGGVFKNDSIPMVVVYSINGFEWRDSNNIVNHMGGNWAHRNMTDSLFVYSTFDEKDWMHIEPGWYKGGGMHGGGMMTDSLFFQMMEVYPHNIPFSENEHVFAGYEMGVFLPNGSNNMWNGGGCGGMMNFNSNINYNLHFTNQQINGFDSSPKNVAAKYWDSQTSSWKKVSNAIVNIDDGTVNFNMSLVSNYVILTSTVITSVEQENSSIIVDDFRLGQNYPNPFNPSTTINYTLPKNGDVTLKVFDVLGREVKMLVNQTQQAGNYNVSFNASDLPSGIYFYELNSNNFVQVKKMMLLK